jgi:hypothetical protein
VRFVDTNILLYAVSRDPEERHKATRADELLTHRDLALSVQVLQEFYVQATRDTRDHPLTHRQAVDLVTAFSRFPVQETTTGLVHAAMTARDPVPAVPLGRRHHRGCPTGRLRSGPVRGPEPRPGLRRRHRGQPVPLSPNVATRASRRVDGGGTVLGLGNR